MDCLSSYEIKYKTNVVTQSFMPEFTDNLRTTKVLLTKFDRLVLFAFACMLARSSVVYDGARCSSLKMDEILLFFAHL